MKNIFQTVINALVPAACYYAAKGNENCGHVVVFLAALSIFLSPLVMIAAGHMEAGAIGRITAFRVWSSRLSDFGSCAILIWNGWLWCAAAFCIQWFACEVLFGAMKKKESENPS